MDELLSRAAEAGIHRLAIPTPFAVGRVNAYLIDDDPLTLVDTGPNSGKALDELERALAAHGRRVEDLGLIVVSHQHMDHEGLVAILARRSGAEVAALDLLVPFLAEYSPAMDADDRLATGLMRRHGVPSDVVIALRALTAITRAWGARCDVTMPLRDGDELRLRDRVLHVHHRPGHSPSDTVFHDREHRLALVADHLLKEISSNALISRPLDGTECDPADRPQQLVRYIESMRATQAMEDVEVLLPGHGPPIDDHVALIDQRFVLHERRATGILHAVREERTTAYGLARRMWGSVALTQAYLTLSEVLGHVDLLARDGTVREVEDDDGVVRIEAV